MSIVADRFERWLGIVGVGIDGWEISTYHAL